MGRSRPDPGDRRLNRLFLTRQGKAKLGQTLPEQDALLKKLMSALKPAEIQSLYQFLDRLEEAVGD